MKIKFVEIEGLNRNKAPIKLHFNNDLNIITGLNGAGKTTVLKLIWYVISGNILLALREISFQTFIIDTDIYTCAVYKLGRSTCRIEWTWADSNEIETFEDVIHDNDEMDFQELVRSAEDIPNERLMGTGSSIFLPTFRRIEGGFLTRNRISSNSGRILPTLIGVKSPIGEALTNISEYLSNNKHIFVSSLSTSDIELLLVKKFSELTEQYSEIQQKTSQRTLQRIQLASNEEASTILKEVQSEMEELENIRTRTMQPFEAFKDQVLKFIKLKGITLGNSKESLSIGDSALAINSDSLSSGEKQMLSFLAYNAFVTDAIFIIDEPELSLHVDWQRQLFPALLKQGTSNQFIVATHSPFIYSKYPDKELMLSSDKGNNED